MSDLDKPEIVTICGSMRFFQQMLKVAAELTANGIIVLAPFSVVAPEHQQSDLKVMLDRLHFQKIDLSSWVLVVTDQEGYIGESTRREMDYAEKTGKPIVLRSFDTNPELIAEIARLSGCTIHPGTRTTEELQFIHALADGAFERGYREAYRERM